MKIRPHVTVFFFNVEIPVGLQDPHDGIAREVNDRVESLFCMCGESITQFSL